MADNSTTWKQTGALNVKAPQQLPHGPGHNRRRVVHAGGPQVTWSTSQDKGTLAEGDALEVIDFTEFTVPRFTGTGLLLIETEIG